MCSAQWKSTIAMKNCSAGLCQLEFSRSEILIERPNRLDMPSMPTECVTSFTSSGVDWPSICSLGSAYMHSGAFGCQYRRHGRYLDIRQQATHSVVERRGIESAAVEPPVAPTTVKLLNLFRRRVHEREMDAEMRFHVDMEAA